MLLLMVISYLLPKEEYKKYIQFFISIFLVVLFLRPVLEFLFLEDVSQIQSVFEVFHQKLGQIEFESGEGSGIYEYFFLEENGE